MTERNRPMRHTPTPWHVHEHAPREIWAKLGPIAMTTARPDQCEEANAEFIAHAANCHDELLAALRPFAALYEDPLDDISGGTRVCPVITIQMVKDVKAAITKAEEV